MRPLGIPVSQHLLFLRKYMYFFPGCAFLRCRLRNAPLLTAPVFDLPNQCTRRHRRRKEGFSPPLASTAFLSTEAFGKEREREAVSSSFPRYQCIRQNTQASPPSSLSCSLNPSKASIHFPPPSPQSSPEALDGRKVLRYCCCSPTSGKKGAAAAASCFPPTGGKVRGRERERLFL